MFCWVLVAWVGAAALHGAARAEHASRDTWLLVDTEVQTLSVYRGDELLERFHNISLGRGGPSLDRARGDGTTPLGTFRIDAVRQSARFLLFFRIDFPRPEHALRALEVGRIDEQDYERIVRAFEREEPAPQDTPLGGQLGIHGLGTGSRQIHDALNWTQGCIALSNPQIRRLSRWIRLGMRVEVR